MPENALHDAGRSGKIDLPAAQYEIANSWMAAYRQEVGQP